LGWWVRRSVFAYRRFVSIALLGAVCLFVDPLPEDVVATCVKSERRNPIIVDVFSRMNLMERRGSGLREICMATAAEDAYGLSSSHSSSRSRMRFG